MMPDEVVRKTRSVCPVCTQVIDADLVVRDGQIKMVKACPQHGQFEVLYWADADRYNQLMRFQTSGESDRLQNLQCPHECGLCSAHRGVILIGLIDITNRCNLGCPICLANSSSQKEHPYELSPAQIEQMLLRFKKYTIPERVTIQFSGGEPTLRDDLPDLVSIAKGLGYGRVEVNTNGIRIGREPQFAAALAEAGVDAIGLQFDSLDDGVYEFTRGVRLRGVKDQAIASARSAGLKVILVVTLTKGVNDGHIGDILGYAAENRDVIRRVIGQTLTFVGRGSAFDVEKLRLTLCDFPLLVEKQTHGVIKKEDFFPVTMVAPVAEFLEALTGNPQDKVETHPCCDLATYVYIKEDGSFVPLSHLIPVEPVMQLMAEGAKAIKSSRGLRQQWTKLSYVLRLLSYAVTRVQSPVFRRLVVNSLLRRSYDPMADLDSVLMVSCTSHMDAWNFDVERVERCSIHYLVPDGNIVPFCSYNAFYRDRVEERFASDLGMS